MPPSSASLSGTCRSGSDYWSRRGDGRRCPGEEPRRDDGVDEKKRKAMGAGQVDLGDSTMPVVVVVVQYPIARERYRDLATSAISKLLAAGKIRNIISLILPHLDP